MPTPDDPRFWPKDLGGARSSGQNPGTEKTNDDTMGDDEDDFSCGDPKCMSCPGGQPGNCSALLHSG
tara:strand:- start:2055 stop:2255 length:201 start_codon:yes stop_codon:yes gene_type:complete